MPETKAVFGAEFDDARALWWAVAVISAAVAAFFGVCLRFLSPLPVYDDYQAVLGYVDHLTRQPNMGAKLVYVLVAQHNEYKPVWSNTVVALQYWINGRVDFRVLSLVGDLQVLGIAWVLWQNFADATVRGGRRLVLFVPVALVLFSLNYNETLNWSMPCLQNIGVILFALFSLSLASRSAPSGFVWSCAGLCMTIAASANGFALLPVGLLLFWQQRALWRAAVWTTLTAGCAILYAWHYTLAESFREPARPGHHFSALFPLSFLGNACAFAKPGIRYLSILVGVLICWAFVMAIVRRYRFANPTMFYSMTFLILTALGVAALRSRHGYDASLGSRYKIYSDLLLICCYAFVLHSIKKLSAQRARMTLRTLFVCAVLFCVGNDVVGAHEMRSRSGMLERGAALYHASHSTEGPALTVDTVQTKAMNSLYRPLLVQAEEDGIYRLP